MTSQVQLPFYKHLFLSTSAASLAELVTLPIDTAKVHLQSNVTKVHPPLKNPIFHSMKHIYQNQGGIPGFYRSWASALTRQCLSSGSRLGLYSYFRQTIKLDQHPTHPILGAISQGSLCGFLSSTLALPADVIKTRIQSSHHKITTYQAIKDVYHPKGISGFYRGFYQTSLRAVTISSIQYPLYFGIQDYLESLTKHNQLQNNQLQNNQLQNNQLQNHQLQNQEPNQVQLYLSNMSLNQRTTLSSILTTLGVTMVVYPIDVCKTQVQNSHHQTTINLLKTIFLTHRNPFLLYRGLLLGISRAFPHFWLTATIYENLKSIMIKSH